MTDFFANQAFRAKRGLGLLGFFLLLVCGMPALAVQEIDVDVCVYGGTSGGVVAAVQAARMGKSVALVVVNNHLGGMTSGGLGQTDVGSFGNGYIQGVAREFYTRVGQKYGTGATFTFEPHVAEAAFNDLAQQPGVTIYTNQYLVSVVKQGAQIIAATMNNGNIFRAKMFIDTTYEGDLLAAAGVSYTAGREATNQYGENLNGVRSPNTGSHQFGSLNVNPHIVTNNPASGLLPLVQSDSPGTPGTADQRVQSYNFRLCLTTVATNKLPLTAPANYDTNQYELLARYVLATGSSSLGTFMNISTMPNSKTDINNNGAISTDFIGQSTPYIEADYATRQQIWQAHKDYLQGFLYFLATDLRVPSSVRASMASYGFCQDEFVDNSGWPYQLYVREARRMVSDYVMTQSNCLGKVVAADSIGMAAYAMDSHNGHRIVVNGFAQNEGDTFSQGSIPGIYPVAYRAIVPKAAECVNLLVPWCLSASHIAFGSIRMEPEFMILSQSAGTAAAIAIDDGVAVQDVSIPKLQAQLTADGQALGTSSSNSTGSVNVASLLLDFGPTPVASLADKLNSSAHAVGGLSGTQTNWNTGLTADPTTNLIYSDGTIATNVTVEMGRSTAGGGVINFDDDGFAGTNALGGQLNTGIYAGNSPVKDGFFGGAGGTNALAVGIRVNGLPAGTYSVYLTGRNTSTQNACPEQIYFTSGGSSTTFTYSSSASVQQVNSSPPNITAFALGDNCQALVVTLTAGQSLYLATVGAATNEMRGFLNSVEIVPGLPPGQTNLPFVQLWATDANASRFGPQTGSFTIGRSGNTNVPVTVNLSFGGTATNGVDYLMLNNSITIPANVVSTNIEVLPFVSAVPAGDKVATISLVSNSDYTIGSLSSATVNVEDTPLNSWLVQYFGSNATNALIAGDNASPAGDGVPNLVKYALGLNPTSYVSGNSVHPVILNNYFTFSYTRPDPAPDDITYDIEVSSDLVNWNTNSSTIQQIIFNTNGTATVTAQLSLPVNQAGKSFARLQISRKDISQSIQGATVVAFGDSITFGYGLSGSQMWTSQLATRFNLNLINAGVSGNTSSQGLARIQTDVLNQHPKFVLINFGMNDHVMTALNTPQVSQTTFSNNIVTMVDRIRTNNSIPILVAVNYIIEGDATQYYYNRHPSSYYANVGGAQAWLDAYIQIERSIAAAKGADIVDVRAACDNYNRYDFLRSLSNGAATDDGVHPYIIGAGVYAQLIGDYLALHY